ncbi:hypothetical protein [Streptomyces spectabilis]|uniref:Uncharacterized protein n=1 Tax=Streptomyces spectabilis TaxID=68270 RepID=A0A5P2XD99_STRST|nr:hypothetical protein [Streptomyces spectabilis]MBB5103733.1 hypothetical protein [Streptomyces spectabilis]MCI3904025.1 hypothetical protein [Streptomyces spectabilis]QEV61165.1 hypothetical protein CP982_22695 [Streptomyces spectabilis]GGV19115.1 hypothetical protein GCM10010245_32320 [Streptomyces spectabilis]
MAMVGLFWIAEGDVYVGSKPSGLAPGVRLTPEGVAGLGHPQSGLWLWDDVRALTVEDVPVKSLKRQVGMVVDMALTVGLGGGEDAPSMTVCVETADVEVELTAYVAAAYGYSQKEYDLSRAVLARLTEGAATLLTTLSAMAEWGRSHEGGTPRKELRERLLREWAGEA